jgi:PASTA domain
MSLLGGALPNVMFLIGVLAIGLGLGIELKLVSLNKEIDKTGRIGAIVVGAALVAASLYIYLNPALTSPNQPAPATANGVLAPVQATPSTNAQLIATAPPVMPLTPIPPVTVPDLHGLSEKEAQDVLIKVGLEARKVDQCTGSDQGDPKAKKNRIHCQNPAANVAVPLGTTIEYVMR